jgi:CRP/FNR family transcriptional regulator
MSRSDIANYLRLAAETVSRVLRRFQDQGLVRVDGREVAIARPEDLRKIARAMLRE